MKKKKGLLFIPLLLGLLGCGQDKMEPLKEIKAEMEKEQENVLGSTKTEGDLTVTINQIVFEENMVILDSTMKSEDLTSYADVLPKIVKDGIEKNFTNGYNLNDKNQKEKNITFFEGEELKFSKEDIGREVEIEFASVTGLTDVAIAFPVKVKKLYETEVIPIGKKLEYKDEFITIDSIERSRFYTVVRVENMNSDAMMDGCLLSMYDSDGKELELLSGDVESLLYGRLKDDCKKVSVRMIQITGKNDYKTISESLEIELNQVEKRKLRKIIAWENQ